MNFYKLALKEYLKTEIKGYQKHDPIFPQNIRNTDDQASNHLAL